MNLWIDVDNNVCYYKSFYIVGRPHLIRLMQALCTHVAKAKIDISIEQIYTYWSLCLNYGWCPQPPCLILPLYTFTKLHYTFYTTS